MKKKKNNNNKTPLLDIVKTACKKPFFYVAVFSCFINLFMLTVPIYMLQIFDRVLASYSADTLLYLTLIALFLLLIYAILSFLRSHILIQLSRWLDNRLSPEALLRSTDELLSGRPYAMQSLKDISTLRQTLSGPAMLTLFDAPWVPIYLFVIYLLNPWLSLVALIGSIILFALAYLNELATKTLLREANDQAQKNNYKINISLRNSESIQAMGMQIPIIKQWFNDNEVVLTKQEVASKRAASLVSLTRFVRLTLQILMLGAGAYLVIQNQLTPGMMIAASILLSRALAPVEQAISAWSQLLNARDAFHRLKDYFNQAILRTALMQLPTPKGHLKVENLSYFVPGQTKPLLKKINFSLEPGELLTIIGPSAAGKTTLARLIIGAYAPSKGHVRLDGADVFTWERHDFGQHVGYLPQTVELFPGKVRDNIARMETDAKPEDIVTAAQLAHVHEMILKLPNSYDTDLVGGGAQISGGQRQRIALARALFGNPKLVILDEPNASLDTAGEAALADTLNQLKAKGATVIVISHRPTVLKITDKILLLADGEIKLFGPRDEVIKVLNMQNKAQQK